jgi:hypothetical protein
LRKWPSTDYLLHSRKRANEIQEMDPEAGWYCLFFTLFLRKEWLLKTAKDSWSKNKFAVHNFDSLQVKDLYFNAGKLHVACLLMARKVRIHAHHTKLSVEINFLTF